MKMTSGWLGWVNILGRIENYPPEIEFKGSGAKHLGNSGSAAWNALNIPHINQ